MTHRNVTKGERYAFAWARLTAANKAGFFLEAITICESIMSDRLASYLLGQEQTAKRPGTFKDLIDMAKKQRPPIAIISRARMSWARAPTTISSTDLLREVNEWRKGRNRFVHSIAKSEPGARMQPSGEFIEEAKACAHEGERLARLVIRWHERELRAHRKAATQP